MCILYVFHVYVCILCRSLLTVFFIQYITKFHYTSFFNHGFISVASAANGAISAATE
jgi:hypothetical protein